MDGLVRARLDHGAGARLRLLEVKRFSLLWVHVATFSGVHGPKILHGAAVEAGLVRTASGVSLERKLLSGILLDNLLGRLHRVDSELLRGVVGRAVVPEAVLKESVIFDQLIIRLLVDAQVPQKSGLVSREFHLWERHLIFLRPLWLVNLSVLPLLEVAGAKELVPGVARLRQGRLPLVLLILADFHRQRIFDDLLQSLLLRNLCVAALDDAAVQRLLLEELVCR